MTYKTLQEALAATPASVFASSLDEVEVWMKDGASKIEAKEPIKFEVDLLAYAVMRLDNGAKPYEVYHELEYFDEYKILDEFSTVDAKKYAQQAESIRRYFKNKHMIRRLKGQEISEWMQKVDRIVELPKQVNADSVRVLAKLPVFYKENKRLDEIFKDAVSTTEHNATVAINEEFELVDSYHRDALSEKDFRIFFRNSMKQILMLRIRLSEAAYPLWKAMATPGLKLRITGTAQSHKLPGQEVRSFQLNHNHELEILGK